MVLMVIIVDTLGLQPFSSRCVNISCAKSAFLIDNFTKLISSILMYYSISHVVMLPPPKHQWAVCPCHECAAEKHNACEADT